ncbi:CvpA family protein [Polaromonas sp.]|uniref:CvpA family protein n=1 Tax=Polaromonas sp. TaxID=1869339 RepID=UPI0024875375|nr:CvpA family protein [Polaromonas sp.]MDI1272456.1 CvpA family protein [Polaromonas sp.]
MAVADWAFLGVLVVSLLIGAWRGLVYEILSVLGWALSFYVAQWFAPAVAAVLPLQSASDPVRYAAAFVLIFIVSVFLAGLLAVLFKKLVEAIGLRPVDRTLGAAFGLVRGVILLLAVTVVVNMTAFKTSAWWQESVGAGVLTAAVKGLKPVLPEQFAKYL